MEQRVQRLLQIVIEEPLGKTRYVRRRSNRSNFCATRTAHWPLTWGRLADGGGRLKFAACAKCVA